MYLYCIPDYDCVAVFVNVKNSEQIQRVVTSVLKLQIEYNLTDIETLVVDGNEISFTVTNKKAYKLFKQILKDMVRCL